MFATTAPHLRSVPLNSLISPVRSQLHSSKPTMVTDDKHTHHVVTVTDDHHPNHKHPSRYNIRRTISITIVLILILAGITALVLWLLYHPHNPKFTVVGAAVYAANTSSPDITAIQFTIVTRNPNDRVSIYYDSFTVFLSYENRPIAPPLMLPPLYHKRDSTVSMSPIWPVSSTVVNGLVADDVGVVSLRLVVTGNLRWNAGNIVKSGRKGVYVGCDVLVGLKRGMLGQVPLVRPSFCSVDI
ncbi:hypothetical protein E3N88_02147 [Mikania micrantha]|uniref:Late embryogenesis abundant protein LEA-2 subgroup domain-containing protein n=1 Tax=Mikania micrantha TaxID=192012 RepID=A0A5N6Q4Y5_9ASTR|nr:hypothetical protein E3N88_02147 [Mikania micrantha]